MSLKNYAIPIETYSKSLKLYFFGEADGYDDIVITNSITGEVVNRVERAYARAEKDSFFPFTTITVTDIEPGVYNVSSVNPKTMESSYSIRFTMTGDSKKDLFRAAVRFSGVANDDVESFVQDISDDTCVQEYLFKKYKETKEDENNLRVDIATVINAYLSILNARIRNMNLTYPNFVINQFDGSFDMDPSAASVIRFDTVHGDVCKVDQKPLTNKNAISMRDDSIYVYVEVDEDGIPMSQQIVFVPRYDIREKMSQMEIDRAKKYKAAMESLVSYPSSYLEFSEQEQEYITLIDKLQADTAWITAPNLTIENRYISAEINKDDKSFFSIFGEDLYLAFSEPELCLEDGNQRTIPLPMSIRFLADDISMIDEDYLYWVENSKGKILSDIRVFNPSGDNEYIDDLNNRIRLLFLNKYNGHLAPYAMAKYKSSEQDIKDEYLSCIEESDVSKSNLHTRLLQHLCTVDNVSRFPSYAMCIEEDRVLYGDYYTQFFTSPVRYKYKEDTIVLPPGKNTVYRIDIYNFGSHKIFYIPCKELTATEYRFYNSSFAIVSAINTEDMRMSGFILLDFSINNIRANVYQFLIDTAEVIY